MTDLARRAVEALESIAKSLETAPPRGVDPCPCECNNGGFCGGCGHAGCGGRRTRP